MTLSEFRHDFLTLFQTWAMTHFSQVPDGGLLAMTAMDLAMNIPIEKLEICKVMRRKPIDVVHAMTAFFLEQNVDEAPPIDRFDKKRWLDTCKICEYDALDHLVKQRRVYDA